METLHSYFEYHADKHPDNIAIICNSEFISYRLLNHRANQLAYYLLENQIGIDCRVALLLERSVDLFVAMLAILKVGAAYVPLDPEYPQDRIEYILKDSNAQLLLTSTPLSTQIKQIKTQTILMDLIADKLQNKPFERLELDYKIDPRRLCYIIYTSGTTGWPKGVAVVHQGVCNYIDGASKIYGVTMHDRIYQGFSCAFDASVEEIWMAFANGATLIPGVDNTIHKGAGLVEFLNFHQITFFSTVPTMLTMLDGTIPTLRILILGGEVCHQKLVEQWSMPFRRIFNTYGPTEASIVTTIAECAPGKAITIGKPLPNYEVLIVDDNLKPVPPETTGELCIAGISLAREYINKAQLTQQRFINHPAVIGKRLYRSGDQARFNQHGELEYIGRLDGQIKLRGFRIELAEIEQAIMQYPGVLSAAVTIHELVPGIQSIIAYIILREQHTLAIDPLKHFLMQRLAHYMCPSLFETVTTFPLLASGKVDRKRLPKPLMHQNYSNQDYVAPHTPLQKKITNYWQELFKLSPISIKADFFHDLGGHSLAAAKIISLLRKDPEMQGLSTLDLYENPTIAQLAHKAKTIAPQLQNTSGAPSDSKQKNSILNKFSLWGCSVIQALCVCLQVTITPWQFFLMLFLALTWSSQLVITSKTIAIFLLFLLLLEPLLFVLAIAGKWILLGKVKPGQYKLWGGYYLRWWLANQLQDLAPIKYIVGTPLISLYCRLMGAKIGKHCFIGTDHLNIFDLLSVGDYSSIGADANIQGYTVENGWLKIGSIEIGERCFVGTGSVLGINTKLGKRARLGEHSCLPTNSDIKEYQSYLGSPARPGNVYVPEHHVLKQLQGESNNKFKILLLSITHYCALVLMELIYGIAVFPGTLLLGYCCYVLKKPLYCLWAVPLASMMYLVFLCCGIVLIKKLILGKVKPGFYDLYSFNYLRIWLIDRLNALSLSALEPLYATIYTAMWFRALGAKIGKRTEISTVGFTFPDLVTLGDENFVADSTILGAARVYCGYLMLGPINHGNRVFIGNGAIISLGTKIGDNCLIGCLSTPPISRVAANNTNWFGTPAVPLPRREQLTDFCDTKTYYPSVKLRVMRGIVDFFKIILPPLLFYLILTLEFISLSALSQFYNLMTIILIFPLLSLIILLGIISFIIILKWILIGRYRETAKPLWSPYVWLCELITGLYDSVMVPLLLEGLQGTPFFAAFLRLLGAQVGKRVFINSPYFSEFDLIHIGNDVTINSESTIQTHLFEDRIFKMGKIKIEDHCCIGNRSIVLYDTIMETGSSLGDLSLLMKGESLPRATRWEGVPAQMTQ